MDARILSLQQQAARRPDVITLSGGLPSSDLLPREALALALPAVHARPMDTAMQYGWPEGRLELRRWVAERLVARGAAVEPDHVVITSGAQQALALAVAVLVKRGDRVHVGSLTYPAALDVIALHGGVPSARLDSAACHYVMPAVGNPGGIDVPLSVQAAILASGAPVITDEAYAELRFDGVIPRPWLCAARDRVWHVGTVSKTICPGLRVGWLVPPPGFRARVLEAKYASDLQAGSLAQATLVELLGCLDYDEHVARARAAYAQRAERLMRALRRFAPGWRVVRPEGGFSVWVECEDLAIDDVALLARAVQAGVSLDPGRLFRPRDAQGGVGFRLSFSSPEADRIEEGVRRLAAAAACVRRRSEMMLPAPG